MAPPKATTKTPAAAAALKKAVAAASKKTTGESEADYPPSAPVRVVSKTYGLSTYDKYAVSEYAEGSSDFYEIEFYVNGVLPEVGGYLATLSEDGYTLKWSRPIEGLLFRMEHLKSIMGDDYSPSHVRVRAFDNVTQTMFKDKVEPDANGLYWGKRREWPLLGQTPGDPPEEEVHGHSRHRTNRLPRAAQGRFCQLQRSKKLPVPHDHHVQGADRGTTQDRNHQEEQDDRGHVRCPEQPGHIP